MKCIYYKNVETAFFLLIMILCISMIILKIYYETFSSQKAGLLLEGIK